MNETKNNIKSSESYNTQRTSIDQSYYTNNTMDTTTWIWLIVAIATIIIIAAVWYYTMQGTNHNDNQK